ncbi:hypothetical protein WICPIJ_003392 [Wickerhamomyces pijperi]|uniref:RRM domain-containing protein n=1 Tax=Wickerhamomyces pijperi TaxID=599730 RepID=A0A9P8Q9Y0_WICPI|nr:hypothetical protein WICPIJ_003392 [Wickerhamomyces pijperi]
MSYNEGPRESRYIYSISNRTHGTNKTSISLQDSADRSEENRDYQRERSPSRRSDNYSYRDRQPDRRNFRDSRDYRDSRGPRDSSYGTSKSNRNYGNSIFVGGVPYECDSMTLKNHFAGIGNVIRADIVTQNGRHRGMGTVEFSSKEEVNDAIAKFDHTDLMGREIFVRQDNPPPTQGSRFDGPPRDRYERDSRDRGRDRYDRGGFRDSGRDRFDRGDRDRYPPRRDERGPPRREGPIYEVFVGNLPFSVNWQRLKDIFKEVGDVSHADVKLDDRGNSRGYGVVSFRNHEGVVSAVEKLNQTVVDDRTIDVREGRHNSAPGQQVPSSSAYVPAQAANEDVDMDNFVDGFEPSEEPSDAVYVKNLTAATSDDDLKELFGAVSAVSRAGIKRTEGETVEAVVQFVDSEATNAAISTLNNYDYGSFKLSVTFARKL